MIRSLSRRTILSSLAAMPAAMLLAACSDSGGEAEAQDAPKPSAAAPAKPAVETPEAQGTVDMTELLKPGALPDKLEGESRVVRKGSVLWRKPFLSGEGNMSHTIANLEYHHFKYGLFRRPGDLHVHFFGTATLSFGDGIRTEPGDVFEIEMAEFGAPLRNRLAPARGGFAYGGVGAL